MTMTMTGSCPRCQKGILVPTEDHHEDGICLQCGYVKYRTTAEAFGLRTDHHIDGNAKATDYHAGTYAPRHEDFLEKREYMPAGTSQGPGAINTEPGLWADEIKVFTWPVYTYPFKKQNPCLWGGGCDHEDWADKYGFKLPGKRCIGVGSHDCCYIGVGSATLYCWRHKLVHEGEIGPVPPWREMALPEPIGEIEITYYYGKTINGEGYKAVAKSVKCPLTWDTADRNMVQVRTAFTRLTGIRLWRLRPAVEEFIGGEL